MVTSRYRKRIPRLTLGVEAKIVTSIFLKTEKIIKSKLINREPKPIK